MKTIIRTKIYEIRRSAKGWSESYEFYFDKERAAKRCRELQIWAADQTYKQNFRLHEISCEDSLIYTIDK